MHQPHFSPPKYYVFTVSGTHFCRRLSKLQGLMEPEGLDKFKISPHWVSNPLPSGLWPSALTTWLPRAHDILTIYIYKNECLYVCLSRMRSYTIHPIAMKLR
jgi:hypothetical protein